MQIFLVGTCADGDQISSLVRPPLNFLTHFLAPGILIAALDPHRHGRDLLLVLEVEPWSLFLRFWLPLSPVFF